MPSYRFSLLGPYWPYRGGIAHFDAALVRGLAGRGHDVQPVTFSRQYPERLFPGQTQYDPDPLPTDLPPAPRLLDTLGPLSWQRTARHVIASGSDALVVPYWMPFFAPSLGWVARRARRVGIRVVGVVHNALPHERRPGDRSLGRYLLGACDGLLVMSDQVRRDVERLDVPGQIVQVAHPVYDLFGPAIPKEQARSSLGLDPDAPTFLFFGFIRRYKGLHVLLEAMTRVREAVPEARLVVAGEFYADEAELRAQAAALGDAVRLDAHYIPDAEVGRYVCAADAVVQPYVSATQSGVAQIAFHFGRPVITTDVGGLAEIVPDGGAGLVVPPEDPAALAQALVRFVREDLGDVLAEGVRRERARYSWEPLLDAIEDLGGVPSSF